jgi:hypothetical protein
VARDPITAARELCLAFPGTEEVESRGSPNFRVAGKTFAIFALNHHGDGHVALWLDSYRQYALKRVLKALDAPG